MCKIDFRVVAFLTIPCEIVVDADDATHNKKGWEYDCEFENADSRF